MKVEEIREAEKVVYLMMSHPGSKYVIGGRYDSGSSNSLGISFGINPEIGFGDENRSQNLNDILGKLRRGDYYSKEEWIREVYDIYRNLPKFYGESIYSLNLSKHLIEVFKKALKYKFFNSSNDWADVFIKVEKDVGRIIKESPLDKDRKKSNLNGGQKITSQLISEKELSQFTKGIQMIKDVEEQESLLEIIRKNQNDIKIDNIGITHINVIELRAGTIRELTKRVKELLKQHGLSYPG